MIRISDVMTHDPVFIAPETAIADAISLMRKNGVRHLPVVEDGRLVGIVSSKDTERRGKTVQEIMTRKVLVVAPDATLETAAALMAVHGVSSLPVVAGQALSGIVTTYDLLDALLRQRRR